MEIIGFLWLISILIFFTSIIVEILVMFYMQTFSKKGSDKDSIIKNINECLDFVPIAQKVRLSCLIAGLSCMLIFILI